MGATTFMTRAEGKTPEEAFRKAVDDALYFHGHGGYTGSIAEKRSFVVIPHLPAGKDPRKYAEELLQEDDPRIEDKWGPAGCIKVKDGEYLFFGWASV